MGGCFGDGAQYFDVAVGAALMSQAVGAPVRVQLMRWDEISWGQTSPPSLMDVQAGVDSKGNLVAFDLTHFYPQYWANSVQTNGELAGTPLPAVPSYVSGQFWPAPMYNIPNGRYVVKSIPLVGNWIKVYWLRGGSAPHVTFAGEQVMDELAHAAKMDPVAFRIQNITQGNDWLTKGQTRDQLLAVLNAVTKEANWTPRVTASNLSDANVVSGRGFAWSNADNTKTYAQTAAIADIEVNKKSGKITVTHIYNGIDAGLVVNPEGVANQMDGGAIFGLSRALSETFTTSKTRVTSLDWVTYPILRFQEAPKITNVIVNRPEKLPLGVGEPPCCPIPAAVANAFFDATGVRIREAPMTPARVRETLKAAGVV
jgi:CO/xanthine dehydrogenase Mo-binding subunit